MPDERRQHNRYAVAVPVGFKGNITGRGSAMDVSVLGCAVTADHAVAMNAYLTVTLSLPDGESPMEIDLAIVRWSYDRKFGIEFIAFGEAQKKRLLRFLEHTAPPFGAQT